MFDHYNNSMVVIINFDLLMEKTEAGEKFKATGRGCDKEMAGRLQNPSLLSSLPLEFYPECDQLLGFPGKSPFSWTFNSWCLTL